MSKAAMAKHSAGVISPFNAATCQICGAPTDVADSRLTLRYGFTAVCRRRRCTECKKVHGTIEISRNQFVHLLSTVERLQSVKIAAEQFLISIRSVKLVDTGRDR